jgi:DNA-binding NarL/FixJ family response regulator
MNGTTPFSSTRILVVDDHAIVRECLCALLERLPGMAVVGLAATGEQALLAAERLRPDLIIMDLVMPGLDGTDATHLILASLPQVRIIVLSASCESEHISGALRAGAHGYVVKEAVSSDLACAVATVLGGSRYLSPQIASRLVDAEPNGEISTSLWHCLSLREREILRRTAAGASTAQIAVQLSLSPKTVDSYRSRSMRKLGLTSRSTLIRYAMRYPTSVF